jgi:hypothetical protein
MNDTVLVRSPSGSQDFFPDFGTIELDLIDPLGVTYNLALLTVLETSNSLRKRMAAQFLALMSLMNLAFQSPLLNRPASTLNGWLHSDHPLSS